MPMERFASYTNVDVSVERLAACKQRHETAQLVCADLCTSDTLVLPRKRYDVAVACRVVNHVPVDRIFKAAGMADSLQIVVTATTEEGGDVLPMEEYVIPGVTLGHERPVRQEEIEEAAGEGGWMMTRFVRDCRMLPGARAGCGHYSLYEFARIPPPPPQKS